PMFYFVGENIHYNMALKLAMDYSNLRIKQITADYLVLADPGEKEIRIPLIERDRILINWAGKWKDAFNHYSFVDVLAGYNSLLKNEAPHIDVEPFKDSICLVAVTALGLFDIKASPLEPQYPGIGVLAMAMRNVIEDDFIKMSPPWVKWASVYILALLVAFSILGRNPLRENLLIACVAAIFLITSFLCFKKGIIIDVSLPMLVLFVNYITISTYSYVRASIEKQRFFKLANTDGLTGLYNHRYFKMILKTECLMAESEINKGFCVIMTDIDHFKKFNDNYGHQVGDLVLAGVANTLKSSVRYSDIVARYGGEEMIILLRNAPLDDGVVLAEKIRKNVEALELSREGGNPYKVTISLGVCCYNVRDSVETVIERADQALYKAKESGRNQSIAMETKSQSIAMKISEERSSQK
ncbi:MAG: diguanylate cyclase, partial [Candidatus Aureabacteria bacterium]|nr:diguanylate cyclase [Candidatus Auribacterota bacterium]